ncbi:universal stress protein [Streptomyces griseoaurantiacus]|uniref:universal stress protein n=1 Tax=Streptomyces griseoaurantiacus TaxID=68213 RepID=UPI0030E40559
MRERHVAVGVDGSPVSTRALDRAADEATRRNCALRVVYAVSDRDEAPPILHYAERRVTERHPGLRVETEAVEGGVVRALTEAGESATLVVVGHRDLGGLAGLVLGSVSLRLAAKTRVPLLVVRGDHAAEEGGDVLLGLRDTPDRGAAVHAFREAEHRATRLRVLRRAGPRHEDVPSVPLPDGPHVGPAPRGPVLRERAETDPDPSSSDIALARELYPAVEVDTRTARAPLLRVLPRATEGASVVVIGTRPRTGPGPRPGRLVHTLLCHSHCPVLLVPDN